MTEIIQECLINILFKARNSDLMTISKCDKCLCESREMSGNYSATCYNECLVTYHQLSCSASDEAIFTAERKTIDLYTVI